MAATISNLWAGANQVRIPTKSAIRSDDSRPANALKFTLPSLVPRMIVRLVTDQDVTLGSRQPTQTSLIY
jgi:hypothetical protein